MTRTKLPIRVRDLPPEHAELLNRIHELAGLGARLRHAVREGAPVAPDSCPSIDQLDDVDRDRSLAEIHAGQTGVPIEWINQARSAGLAGHPWSRDRMLPHPRSPVRRRSNQRLAADVRQLAEMAAVSVVREHRLAAIGVHTEPEPAAAMQLRRNMQALWMRARLTAEATAMNGNDRASIFGAAITEVDRRIADCNHNRLTLDELNIQWTSHTAPAIADGLRRSLKRLRRTTENLITTSDDLEPPTPKALMERARRALAESPDAGATIEAAVLAAIPEAARHSWNADVEPPTAESSSSVVFREAGPDP